MPGKKRRAAAILGATLLASALVMPSAHAVTDSDPTTASITAGGLNLGELIVDDFGPLNITGTDQTTTADIVAFTVADLRGGFGGGWDLTAEASQFSTGGATPLTLPASSLDMQVPVPTTAALNLAAPPSVPLTPVTLDGGAPVEIASADPGALPLNSGTGTWTFDGLLNDELTLSVPADVQPGDYTSTVTMTLSAAP